MQFCDRTKDENPSHGHFPASLVKAALSSASALSGIVRSTVNVKIQNKNKNRRKLIKKQQQ